MVFVNPSFLIIVVPLFRFIVLGVEIVKTLDLLRNLCSVCFDSAYQVGHINGISAFQSIGGIGTR